MSRTGTLFRHALTVVQQLFVPLALACLAYAAYQSRDVVGQVLKQARPEMLAVVVLLWAGLNLLPPIATWLTLRALRAPLRFRDILGIHVIRLPARYLPGGIWHTVSRVVDFNARGVGRTELSVMVVLENLAPFGLALIGGGTLAWIAGNEILPNRLIVALGIAIVVTLPWLLRLTLRSARPIPLPAYGAILGVLTVFWVVAGAAFYLYLGAFRDLQLAGSAASAIATYLLSWAAGFVSVFAPQGIGVFELVAGFLLEGDLPLAGIAVIVAGFRAATLAGDALAYGIGLVSRGVPGRPAGTAD